MKIAHVTAVANGTTSTQDFTVSGFGTPKAVLFFGAKSGGIGTLTGGLKFFIGATDGTRQWLTSYTDQNAVTTTLVNRAGNQSNCVGTPRDTVSFTWGGLAAFDSWITDGVRINWSSAETNVYITAVLLAGDDLDVRVDKETLDLVGDYNVTDPNFAVEAVIAAGMYAQDGTYGSQANARMTMGFARDASTVERASLGRSTDNNVTTTSIYGICRDDRLLSCVSSGAEQNRVDIKDFDSQGFTLVGDNTQAYTMDVNYLALSDGGKSNFKVKVIDTPTATGNQAFTGFGFKPHTLLILTGSQESVNTYQSQNEAHGWGVSCVTDTGEATASVSSRGAQTTSDTDSISDNDIHLLAYNTYHSLEATLVSFDNDGFTLNFSNINADAKKWVVLAIGDAPVGAGAQEFGQEHGQLFGQES